MVDLSRLMQDAAILEVIDKSADEASNLSAQNSYQAMRIEELERAHAAALEELSTLRKLLQEWQNTFGMDCGSGEFGRIYQRTSDALASLRGESK